jgi:transposase InsO family protein
MITPEDKQTAVNLIHEAVESGARKWRACEVLEISLRTCQRWERDGIDDSRKGSAKKVLRKLSPVERQAIIDVSGEKRFRDLNPHHIVPILAEEGRYIASESTFYRVLRAASMVNHRENSRPRSSTGKPPELVATGPNQVWSWDITWLKSEVRGIYYYCYMIKDIWKKDIVGWEIHDYESVDIAAAMFRRLKTRRNLKGVHLHADNGNPMKGSTMIVTLHNLGIIPSFSRPRVSDDNPFIESLFKTIKYVAGYPGNFRGLDHARSWMADFVNWYNTEHRHSAIGYITPAQRGTGKDLEIFECRNSVLETARSQFPERWVNGIRRWENRDVVVLNPDKKLSKKTENAA